MISKGNSEGKGGARDAASARPSPYVDAPKIEEFLKVDG